MSEKDSHAPRFGRRVVVGVNSSGASAVVSDDGSIPTTELANGIILQEVWQQRDVPAKPLDHPQPDWTLGPAAPTAGAVVRILTVPGGHGSGPEGPDLHTDASLHVITMLEGELIIALEDGNATLRTGDSIILRGSMHDLRNEQADPATFVYTSFPLRNE
ncbi:hypothetical protein [Pseudarthrobacter phenanthrenivorans]|uniref:hypothetical protein n=1 Tax=Pseudarthrobacter phenanthrenivorans TaxID=361575 RepID=UPI0005B9A071|nr:hypothetical protein [Pseudarthrobacter phenanthrenivorans]